MTKVCDDCRFLVGISYPGTAAVLVSQVAEGLGAQLGRDRVFFSPWYEAELARPDLDLYLQKTYQHECALVVAFFCQDYSDREWCNVEWRSMRQFLNDKSRRDRLMPIRLDATDIDGFQPFDGYFDAIGRTPEEIGEAVVQRLLLLQTDVVVSSRAVLEASALPERRTESGTQADDKHAVEQSVNAATIIGPVVQHSGSGDVTISGEPSTRWIMILAAVAVVGIVAAFLFLLSQKAVPGHSPLQIVPWEDIPAMPQQMKELKETLDRGNPAYDRSDVVIQNLTDRRIWLGYSYTLRGVELANGPDDYGVQVSEFVEPNATDSHQIELLGGPVFFHVFYDDEWYPAREWSDIGITPVRYITVRKFSGGFRFDVSRTGPIVGQ